ncbi:MAG: PAS domain-containing sensor histidine kinase [Acidobacteria bacterium]|nr:MAG: PAS domain-containing sensor histidine kinase [Acidobacteriota bacterium]PYV79967.1 MAG: PAS domain-containing sensor histidine kinase [Acidobacteriota bacterium]
MRRRTQIVLAITFMVAALVSGASYIYITQILRQGINTTHDTATNVAAQIAYLATNAAPDLSSTRVDTTNPEAVRRGVAYYLGTDRDLNTVLDSVVGSYPTIYDAAVLDSDGKAILDTDPNLIGKKIADRPDFSQLQQAGFRRKLRMVYNPPTIYDVHLPLMLNGQPFGSIHVGVSTVFLRNELTPRLQRQLSLSGIAVLCSLVLAALLSNLALGPLEHINRSLDRMAESNGTELTGPAVGADEYGKVSLKIAHLGKQMRDAREIFSALKSNVDQIMASLQDGLMLFTRDSRVVLVSAAIEGFLGRSRSELLGRTVKEIFSAESALGGLMLDAFRLHHNVEAREIEASNGRRVHVSLDFIQEKGTQIGALLTMRDAESARRIEDEIELSRRISASGRVTRGVAHEVKNPINAIVLHLQLLRNKLQQVDPDTSRHVDIIDSEVHRLDRVVQILVDFTRPRDLRLEETDLRLVLDEVSLLATPDAEQHGVKLVHELPAEAVPVKIDVDFIKQAMLNVVLNGVQAMPNGGTLTLTAFREDDMVVTEIRDQGAGIPSEIQDKIFELYFTTKKTGSGIGLAQTYQIMQWHYGSVDFESGDGKGTTFRLRLPLAATRSGSLEEAAART